MKATKFEMETRIDFVRWLDVDVVLKILMCLNDPADLIRASAVSQYWQNFALFQVGSPVYSSKFVRFRMGRPKSLSDIDRDFLDSQEDANDKFVWTYTSQTFSMVQENRIQCFELPEPVLCIGGFLQIEFSGRIQKQRADGKYYICMAHVEAIGRPLSPAFNIDISEPSKTISLKYNSEEFIRTPQQNATEDDYIKLHANLLHIQPPRELVWGNLQEFVDVIQLQQNVMEFAWINDDMDEFDPVALMM